MAKLNPDKLFVEFMPCVTPMGPIIPRRYTLTHSDTTADLFLSIGFWYAYSKINPMRDEVLAQWCALNGQYALCAYCYVDGKFGYASPAIRYAIFRRELPLALEAIRYGDRALITAHPILGYSPVWVHFISSDPFYNRIEYWGTMDYYREMLNPTYF